MTADAELLCRYLYDRDDAAFAAIVRKHGPMVLAACRRIAPNRADAEDAFQATFLVLATKAESVRPHSQLGAWLHGVAVRCGKKARDSSRRFAGVPLPDLPSRATASPEPDLSAVIDDALASIPHAYRAAVVLCHLEGRTRAEAARELGWSEGTLSGRLHRALKLLGERLSAKGITAAGAVVLAVLSARSATASVPLSLVAFTCSAAGLVSAGFAEPGPAHSLARGVLRAMTLRKLKLAAVAVGLFGLGAFALFGRLDVPTAVAAPVPADKGSKEKWKRTIEVEHTTTVTAVAMNDDMLATAGDAGDRKCNLRLWNPKGGDELKLEVRGAYFTIAPNALRFVSGGKYLMMVAPDDIIRYERRGGGLVGDCFAGVKVFDFADDLNSLALHDAKLPLTRLNIHPNLWGVKNAVSNPLLVIDHPNEEAVTHAVVSYDGGRLVVGNADSAIRVYGPLAEKPKEAYKIELPAKTALTTMKLSPDGKRLAVVGEKGLARVYDADTGKEQCELKGHDGTVAAVVFTPDGKRVATANGKTVRVFDTASGKKLSEWEAHTDDVTCLAFTPDGKKLVTGSKDKSAKVWERE